MDYSALAQDILRHVGGAGNVSNVVHCATRLRFRLNNQTLADKDVVRRIEEQGAVVVKAQLTPD